MKKLYFILYAFTLIGCNSMANPKNIKGLWQGKLSTGSASLSIVFHVEKQSENSYSASMDSPDQGANGIPCDKVTIKEDSVIIWIKAINGGYKGLLVNDSTMNGNWEQSGMKIPLTLKKGYIGKESPKVATNVDTNCIETDITLETKTGKIFGTLCVPKGFVKGPVALIIAGSGPTDREGNNNMGLTTDAYKILAHKLAEQNIATVRYDKRGIAESHAAMKSESDITFDDFINDAVDWIKMLKADKRFAKVIVIGHSEGSLIGMIAAKRADADAYISIAGAGEGLDKTLKRQLSSQPKSVQDSVSQIMDSLLAGKTVKNIGKDYYSLFRPSVQPFLISMFKYNPTAEISKLTIPVLILQGTSDIQVTVDDAKKLSDADKKAKMILLQNMNHIFRVVEGDREANLATYNNPTLPIDPELVTDIGEFIKKN